MGKEEERGMMSEEEKRGKDKLVSAFITGKHVGTIGQLGNCDTGKLGERGEGEKREGEKNSRTWVSTDPFWGGVGEKKEGTNHLEKGKTDFKKESLKKKR